MTADLDIYTLEAPDAGEPLGSAMADIRDILRNLIRKLRKTERTDS